MPTDAPKAPRPVPEHAPAQNSGDIPAWTQAPPAQPGPQPRGDTPRAPNPIPDLSRNSPATRPVAYVHRHRLPKSIACSHQMPPPKPQPSWSYSPRRQTLAQGPPCNHHNAPQDKAKGAPPPLGDGAN
ncbi:hypothetical protein AMECASPLE_035156 [Ameca splendens]|uniref:Uncharacterized protein n=1 Tax=Ameca splendens TaxID=208324 RepID=A0ABV1A2P4_9TELE